MEANTDSKPPLDKEKIVYMVEKEMDYRVEYFNRLTHTCFKKCVATRYKDPELHIGENSCIDRCVSKYSQVTNIIGQMMASGRMR